METKQTVILLQLLNKMDHDPLAGDREGNIPAHLAAAEGNLECLRLLVYSYQEDQTAEVVSCRNNNVSIPNISTTMFTEIMNYIELLIMAICIDDQVCLY